MYTPTHCEGYGRGSSLSLLEGGGFEFLLVKTHVDVTAQLRMMKDDAAYNEYVVFTFI